MSSNHVCQPEGDCNLEVRCDGASDACPVTAESHKPDTTFCSSKTRTCVNGRCTGSICVQLGQNATECQCVDRDLTLCDICCKLDGECMSTFTLSRSKVWGGGWGVCVWYVCVVCVGVWVNVRPLAPL